jgi:inhibitor of KinA
MENNFEIFSLSDQAITFSLGNELSLTVNQKLVAMKSWLMEKNVQGIKDIIIAYSSLTVCYDYFDIQRVKVGVNVFGYLKTILEKAYFQSTVTTITPTHWRLPVCYGNSYGPDLEAVAIEKNLSVNSVIEIHCSVTYTLFMIGFLPGFPYLAETDSRIHIPRKQAPRAVVESGSVGLAGKQTGIYPMKSPGGWQIIGRTPVKLFDERNDPPVKFQIGDTISFFPIDELQFANFSTQRL